MNSRRAQYMWTTRTHLIINY